MNGRDRDLLFLVYNTAEQRFVNHMREKEANGGQSGTGEKDKKEKALKFQGFSNIAGFLRKTGWCGTRTLTIKLTSC